MDNDESFELDFNPEDGESQHNGIDVEFELATSPEDFKNKANILLSNTMDVLNTKIVSAGTMAETGDLKAAIEVAKMFKVGIDTVGDVARRELEALNAEVDDTDYGQDTDDSMRFRG